MKRVIEIFLTKGVNSARMIEDIVMLLKLLPPKQRPVIKIRVFELNSLNNYPVFKRMLKERRINHFPTIISDGIKVVEGYYPSLDELERIVLGKSNE